MPESRDVHSGKSNLSGDRSPEGRIPGKVYLIGSGPGDPGLITLRGVELLRRADVVLYDYLVNPRILEHVSSLAEQICLGKHGRSRIWPQQEINRTLVEYAEQGKTVVRLKGGDPAVFARGAEEIEALVEAGLHFEVVPGVTAALAASSYAGIPVTHRDIASAVALVTAHEGDAKEHSSLNYQSLASFPGTLVFYMGVTTAAEWTAALIGAGKSPDTPTAIVRRCSFPDQVCINCTLGEVAGHLSPARRVRPPVIVVVGEVARLSLRLSWFDQRPLWGQTGLVTRPIDQSADLVRPLEELGARVLIQPAIEIGEPVDWSPVDAALRDLHRFQWVVFSSVNGVSRFMDRLQHLGLDLRALGGLQIGSVGLATSDALRGYYLCPDLQPGEYRAEALAEQLAARAEGCRCLLVRASRGREVLAETLEAAGAEVVQVVVYESRDVTQPDPEIVEALDQGSINWVTVTSSAIAHSLHQMFGQRLERARLVSISPITSGTLRSLGLEPAAEAADYTMAGIVQAIQKMTRE